MPKAIAQTTLHICRARGSLKENGSAAKPAAVDVVEAGAEFSTDVKTLKELEENGHARRVPAADGAGSTSKKQQATTQKPPQGDGSSSPAGENQDPPSGSDGQNNSND